MGLTVHFEFTANADVDASRARQIVAGWHRIALNSKQEGLVEDVLPIASDVETLHRFAKDMLILPVPGEEDTSTGVEIRPMAGSIFLVMIGKDCEPLRLGLCRYPTTVRSGGREIPTGKPGRRRIAGFCKTQFASLHGWEYFQRCHCAVVHLLAACRTPAVSVRITDEAGYWPRRSLSKLRQNVDRMNELLAATAGALKDAANSPDAIQSPIFRHKTFERLEAQGAPQAAGALEKLRKTVSQYLK